MRLPFRLSYRNVLLGLAVALIVLSLPPVRRVSRRVLDSLYIQATCRLLWDYNDPYNNATATTELALNEYLWTGNAGPIRYALRRYYDGMSGHEVAIALTEWGIRHPREFVRLTRQFAPEERRNLLKRVAFAVTDGGRTERFNRAFSRYPEITAFVASEPQAVPW